MRQIALDNRAARRLWLARHRLAESPRGALGPEALAALIHDLGFVQIDSINTLERAHHQILAARADGYRPPDLAHLHEAKAALFEHWTHDAALIPTEFYRYWRPRFERDRERLRAGYRRWQGPEFEAELDRVRAHVERAGPTVASDLAPADAAPRKGGGWWDWRPEKTALEFLWRVGELAIVRREAFRKVYDLVERAIPAAARASAAGPAEAVDWACESALRRLGFGTTGEIAAFWDLATPQEAKDWALRNAERLVEAVAAGWDGAPRRLLAFADEADALAAAPEPPPRVRVLSPFDPALRDRARTERLFGFRYRFEVFTPAEKRVFGYYVFPLLEGDRLIGRIDMKAERDADRLAVTALWLEPGVRWSAGRLDRIAAELDRQRRFTGLSRVVHADGWRRER